MASRIPQAFIQELLSRVDLVELLGARLSLKKRGNNYLALCPFHQEKTPSFTVNPTKQFYYCFGCSAHGNALGFLMDFDKLSFPEAVTYLAERNGLTLPKETQSTHQPEYNFLQAVADFYHHKLSQSRLAAEYLNSRHINSAVIEKFSIGYAPSGNHLKTKFSDDLSQKKLLANGLCVAHNHTVRERFQNRIIFPIHNAVGDVIGFGGRSLSQNQLPKYMNSPETALFHKSEELFGLYEAKKMHGKLSQILVVEGYFDVVSLQQHNFPAVATLGTAISQQHLKKLSLYTDKIFFCFDGDSAGQKAADRALTHILSLLRDDLHLYFLILPEQEDPDSIIKKGGIALFEHYLKKALPLGEAFFLWLQRSYPITTADEKTVFAAQALKHLRKISSNVFKELMIKELSVRLGIPLEALRNQTADSLPQVAGKKPTSQVLPPAYAACAILIQHPTLASQLKTFPELDNLRLPGVSLLNQLIDFFQTKTDIAPGYLLECWPNVKERPLLARLASRWLPSPEASILLEELKGALNRLQEHHRDALINELIQKSRKGALSPKEREQLAWLLQHPALNPSNFT